MATNSLPGCTVPKITINKISTYLRIHDKAGDVVMLHGPAGIGKSAVAREYANKYYPLKNEENLIKLKRLRDAVGQPGTGITKQMVDDFENSLLNQDTNFIDVRLSYYEPTDLSGIPLPITMYYDKDGRVVQEWERTPDMELTSREVVVWATPALFSMPKTWKGVILFDELPSTPPAVQAASYQLMLDNRIGDWELSPHAFKMAAGNRENDGGAMHYGIATPLKDRMSHYEVMYDANAFIEYGQRSGIDAEIVAFIRHAPSRVHTLDPDTESPVGGASPRSWEMVSDNLKVMRDEMELGATVIDSPSTEILRNVVASRVGLEIAGEFLAYRKNFGVFPTPQEILTGNYDVESLTSQRLTSDMIFFIGNNLNNMMHSLYKTYLNNGVQHSQWLVACQNYLEFNDKVIGHFEREQCLATIRYLVHASEGLGVIILGSEVPLLNDILTRYQSTMSAARRLK